MLRFTDLSCTIPDEKVKNIIEHPSCYTFFHEELSHFTYHSQIHFFRVAQRGYTLNHFCTVYVIASAIICRSSSRIFPTCVHDCWT